MRADTQRQELTHSRWIRIVQQQEQQEQQPAAEAAAAEAAAVTAATAAAGAAAEAATAAAEAGNKDCLSRARVHRISAQVHARGQLSLQPAIHDSSSNDMVVVVADDVDEEVQNHVLDLLHGHGQSLVT